MNGEQSQCGLTSLLPMSCRGRAEAFARRLHTRLRNLGTSHESSENSWLTANNATTSTSRDSELFFDFELECESPSSPVEDSEPPFADKSSDDVPFYDVESNHEHNEQKKKTYENGHTQTNGFMYTTSFFNDRSPIKTQPSPRENGHLEGRRISAINLEDCAKHDSLEYEIDEPDCSSRISPPNELLTHTSVQLPLADSDSDFESAKSDPSEIQDFPKNQTLQVNCISINEQDLQADNTDENYDSELDVENDESNESFPKKDISPSPKMENSVLLESEISSYPNKDFTVLEKTDSITLDDVLCEEQETESTEEDKPQRVRRCSSLKTGKTPPGTPGRKKIVRFADVLGLDLADVKTFLDEIPVIPKSAYDDLSDAELAASSPPVRSVPRLSTLTLVPLFQLPVDITEVLQSRCVCLEAARVMEGVHITICGSVRVRNLDFNKTVHVRYTINSWRTFTDLQATYVPGSCDGFSDRFQFVLYAPCISAGQRLELAVRFQCKGCQYWDNNTGHNYRFDCLPLGAMPGTCSASIIGSGPLHPTRDWHPSFY